MPVSTQTLHPDVCAIPPRGIRIPNRHPMAGDCCRCVGWEGPTPSPHGKPLPRRGCVLAQGAPPGFSPTPRVRSRAPGRPWGEP